MTITVAAWFLVAYVTSFGMTESGKSAFVLPFKTEAGCTSALATLEDSFDRFVGVCVQGDGE